MFIKSFAKIIFWLKTWNWDDAHMQTAWWYHKLTVFTFQAVNLKMKQTGVKHTFIMKFIDLTYKLLYYRKQ